MFFFIAAILGGMASLQGPTSEILEEEALLEQELIVYDADPQDLTGEILFEDTDEDEEEE